MIHFALAAFESDPVAADFLCDYGIKRLPADAAICEKAVDLLLKQDRSQKALGAARKSSADGTVPEWATRSVLVADIGRLCALNRHAEALVAYRSLLGTAPSPAILAKAQRCFAHPSWTVTWFPSDVNPREHPDAWRADATKPEAVSAEQPALDFKYGRNGPKALNLTPELTARGPSGENFGMIARAKVTLPAGRWRFALRSDDGSRLIVNGQPLIDTWIHQTGTTKTGDFEQTADGAVDLVVEYFQLDRWAELQLLLEPLLE